MFLNRYQSYDSALAVTEAGGAQLVRLHWQEQPSVQIPVANELELDHLLYTRFAEVAPKEMQSFICGPFGNWDGTSQGVWYDGMVFGTLRQPFIDALQHFRADDGARYIWDFLTEWEALAVLGPSVEVRRFESVWTRDGEDGKLSQHLFATIEEADAFCKNGWASRSGAMKVVPVGQLLS